jgi:hypothetical protein
LEKKKFTASGAALAFAAALRVFPLILLSGIIFRSAFDFWKKKKFSPNFSKFFIGFIITALVLFFYGSLDQNNHFDFSRWLEFGEKIIVHSQANSNQRSGLAYLVPSSVSFLKIPIIVAVFSFFAFAARRAPKEKLIPLGLLLVPIVSSPASYYFCSVAILVLAFSDLNKKQNAIALSCILGAFILQSFVTIQENIYHNSLTSYNWSALYLILSLVLMFIVSNKKLQLKTKLNQE